MESGQMYGEMKKSIVISILCGTVFPESEKMHHVFRYCERTSGKEMTDKSEIHFFELSKLDEKKKITEMTALEKFGAYLRYAAMPEREAYIEELLHCGSEVIEMSEPLLKRISSDEELREWQRAQDQFLLDQKNMIWEAEERGLKEGIAEGKSKKHAKIE